MRANLLNEPKKKYTVKWKLMISTILAVFLIAIMIFNYNQSKNRVVLLKREVKKLDSQLNDILSKKEDYLQLQSKIENIKENERYISQYSWDKVIREQGYLISEEMKINSLEIENNKLFIEGFALNNVYFLKYLENFYDSPLFGEIKINYLNRQEELHFNLEASISEGGSYVQ